MPAYDGNGNVYGMVDRFSGALRAVYEYSPTGETLRASGDMAAKNPFRFSTKYTDSETQMLYYGFRYYSPSLGRFYGRDPIEEKGGLHLYAFCGNNSLNGWDYIGALKPGRFASSQGWDPTGLFASMRENQPLRRRIDLSEDSFSDFYGRPTGVDPDRTAWGKDQSGGAAARALNLLDEIVTVSNINDATTSVNTESDNDTYIGPVTIDGNGVAITTGDLPGTNSATTSAVSPITSSPETTAAPDSGGNYSVTAQPFQDVSTGDTYGTSGKTWNSDGTVEQVAWANSATMDMKLPDNPSGLGPEWVLDPSHRDPNGAIYRHPGGDSLEWNKGRPGATGWKGVDHWHRNGDHSKPGHLLPGTDIPDPIPPSLAPSTYSTTDKVIVGAGVVGGGYLIYRGVRMIPSLIIPPLWPTIPINAVVP